MATLVIADRFLFGIYFIYSTSCIFPAVRVYIADGDSLYGVLISVIKVPGPLSSDTNETDVDSVAGGRLAIYTEGRRRNDIWESSQSCCVLEKLSAGKEIAYVAGFFIHVLTSGVKR